SLSFAPRIDFTDPNDPRHDVTLVIEGEKIYVSKQILAVHSPVFNAMFYGDFIEKDKKEIELHDVDREEFIKMLNVIYQTNKMVEIDPIDSPDFLLKLGDQFQIACVIERAQELLIKDVDLSTAEKLKIADENNKLYELQEHCFSMLTTVRDFQIIEKSPVYSGLSEKMKAAFLKHKVMVKNKSVGGRKRGRAPVRAVKDSESSTDSSSDSD
ncbi:hypothetical protein PMAYCL1PPCAC_25245, partial [Pristionchus mayeri]